MRAGGPTRSPSSVGKDARASNGAVALGESRAKQAVSNLLGSGTLDDDDDGSIAERLAQRQNEEDEADDDSEELEFNVHDLLVWSAEDANTNTATRRFAEDERMMRPALRNFRVDAVLLFYATCAFILLSAAELLLRPNLEEFGVRLIRHLQHPDGKSRQELSAVFENILSFPPKVWGFLPALALLALPRWASVGSRIILLQGVGDILRWALGVCFRQGRPFWISSKVQMWHCPLTYGFPSGHAFLLLLCIAPVVEELWHDRAIRERRLRHAQLIQSRRSGNFAGVGDENGEHSSKASLVRGHGTMWAVLLSGILITLYSICSFGRVLLGTHFPHSMLMGVACSALVLQLLNRTNVFIIADRAVMAAQSSRDVPLFSRILEIIMHSGMIAIFIMAGIALWGFLCNSVADPDSHEWSKRSLKGCGIPLDNTANNSGALRGAAIIIGWVTALSLLGLESTLNASRLGSASGKAGQFSRYRFNMYGSTGGLGSTGDLPQLGSARVTRSFRQSVLGPSYRSIIKRIGQSYGAGYIKESLSLHRVRASSESSTSALNENGRQSLIRTASCAAAVVFQLVVSAALLLLFPCESIGVFISLLWALYFFPVFVSNRLFLCA